MERAQGQAELPPLPEFTAHVLEAFVDAGKTYAVGFGHGPLPYSEIESAAPWADAQDRVLIRKMSDAYLRGMKIGQDPFGIPPWQG